MESKFGFDLYISKYSTRHYPLFEGLTFGEGEGIRFCNDRDDIDDVGQFLQDNNIDGFQAKHWSVIRSRTGEYACPEG